VHQARHLDGGEVDYADSVTVWDVLVADVEAGVQYDAAVISGLFVVRHRDAGPGTHPLQVVEHLGQEPGEHRSEVLGTEARGATDCLGDPKWRGGFDDDVLDVNEIAPFECSEVRFDPAQSRLFLADGLLDLGLTHAEHAPKLIQRRVVVQDLADLVERKTEVPQGQEPVQLGESVCPVRAISRDRVYSLRAQQSDLVVVAQHPG
jgi:hypothetical protein